MPRALAAVAATVAQPGTVAATPSAPMVLRAERRVRGAESVGVIMGVTSEQDGEKTQFLLRYRIKYSGAMQFTRLVAGLRNANDELRDTDNPAPLPYRP